MGTHSPRPVTRSALLLGALVLVLCALVAATFDGPRWSALERAEEEQTQGQQEQADEQQEEPSPEESQEQQGEEDSWLPWLPPLDLLLLVPSAIIFGLALIVLARLRLRQRRRQLSRRIGVRETPELEPEPPVDEDVGVPEALDEGARTIGEGSPRNAIVAAWVRLEQAVVSEHFPRRPEETPSELVERALASYRMDGTAIRRLAALYREARFSAHPVTEEHRGEAADCLRRLLATLERAR